MNGADAEREVLARIRGASSRSAPETIAARLAALRRPSAAAMSTGDNVENLARNLRRNGASCELVGDRRAAIDELSRFIAERHGQRRVVTGHDPRLAALPWRDGGLLPRFDSATVGDAVAVSYARYAVAETGSVALWLNRDNPALNNLLVEDHIVLVDARDVRARLECVWEEPAWSDRERRPRGMMIISGPSSTADIAMELVTGAHGPRALHVIVIGAAEN